MLTRICLEELAKTAGTLTLDKRQKLPSKVFAIPKGEGPGGTGKYPIHDEAHARSALSFVQRHGTPEEKSKVFAAVGRRYPHLAARSSIPAVKEHGQKHMKKSASPVERVREAMQKLAFDTLTSPPEANPLAELAVLKVDAVADPELFAIAGKLASTNELGVADGEEVLAFYEQLGGTYKHAFGQQMFDTKQMAGSPAVSGGMAARARNPGPQIPQTPVSVTTTTLGQSSGQQSGGSSAPSQTSTPSAPTG